MNRQIIGQGRTAEICEYGKETILKLYREFVPRDDVNREFEISQYAYEKGVTTPRPYEILQQAGRQGIVYQQIAGATLLALIGKSPWFIRKYAKSMAELHYRLHRVEASGNIGQMKKRMEMQISTAPMLVPKEKSEILMYLEKLPEGGRLCHGDFHPDNVLLEKGKLWIIDWMTGTAGHPAADAARTQVLLSFGSMPPGASVPAKVMIGLIRKKMTKHYLKEYKKLSGQSHAEIEQWVLPVAAARLAEGIPLPEKELLLQEVRKRLQHQAAG